MLLNKTIDSIQLVPTKSSAAFQAHGIEPEFGYIVVPFNVNMGRFVAFIGEKEEPVRANAQNSRHYKSGLMGVCKLESCRGLCKCPCNDSVAPDEGLAGLLRRVESVYIAS